MDHFEKLFKLANKFEAKLQKTAEEPEIGSAGTADVQTALGILKNTAPGYDKETKNLAFTTLANANVRGNVSNFVVVSAAKPGVSKKVSVNCTVNTKANPSASSLLTNLFSSKFGEALKSLNIIDIITAKWLEFQIVED